VLAKVSIQAKCRTTRKGFWLTEEEVYEVDQLHAVDDASLDKREIG
jgi:hypothetical protein